MKANNLKWSRLLLFAVMIFAGAAQQAAAQSAVKSVPSGQPLKMLGIINTRSSESFTFTSLDGADRYVVLISNATSVKSNTKGVFRGGKEYGASYLLRGLRVEVEGTGNEAGELVARSVRFNETDLRTAQSLESRVDPVEQQAIKAQGTADTALAEANRANNRINGLDEFDPVRTITVPFATGSSTLGPVARKTIDEAARWTKTQNTKGWMVAVVGFADSTGNTAANKTLSTKRANAVIGYLVSKHGLALTRLVMPFGAGVDQPAATNATAEGRALNRRVEIRLMVNKGIAGD